jgi:hypothetical protein
MARGTRWVIIAMFVGITACLRMYFTVQWDALVPPLHPGAPPVSAPEHAPGTSFAGLAAAAAEPGNFGSSETSHSSSEMSLAWPSWPAWPTFPLTLPLPATPGSATTIARVTASSGPTAPLEAAEWLAKFQLEALAETFHGAGLHTMRELNASLARDGAAALVARLPLRKLEALRLKEALNTLNVPSVAAHRPQPRMRAMTPLASPAAARTEAAAKAAAAAKAVAAQAVAAAEHAEGTLAAAEVLAASVGSTARTDPTELHGEFHRGPTSPLRWDGVHHRLIDQQNLNLIHGKYDKVT